jgi:hypothetical protein
MSHDTTTTPVARKHTVFHLCQRHAWLANEGRYRCTEFFGEGGPTDGPCTPGDTCKVRPGTDLMRADYCVQQAWYDTAKGDHIFRWAVNEPAVEVHDPRSMVRGS